MSIPVKQSKRIVILEELCKHFEKGREYEEKEVNAILAPLYGDFCTLRRELVDSGVMKRSNGIYTRVMD